MATQVGGVDAPKTAAKRKFGEFWSAIFFQAVP
jgi:hypothetical protein